MEKIHTNARKFEKKVKIHKSAKKIYKSEEKISKSEENFLNQERNLLHRERRHCLWVIDECRNKYAHRLLRTCWLVHKENEGKNQDFLNNFFFGGSKMKIKISLYVTDILLTPSFIYFFVAVLFHKRLLEYFLYFNFLISEL